MLDNVIVDYTIFLVTYLSLIFTIICRLFIVSLMMIGYHYSYYLTILIVLSNEQENLPCKTRVIVLTFEYFSAWSLRDRYKKL